MAEQQDLLGHLWRLFGPSPEQTLAGEQWQAEHAAGRGERWARCVALSQTCRYTAEDIRDSWVAIEDMERRGMAVFPIERHIATASQAFTTLWNYITYLADPGMFAQRPRF